jgi:hypothetical protein
MFAVHAANRKTHAPDENDLKMAIRILLYIKGTKKLKFKMEEWDQQSDAIVTKGMLPKDRHNNDPSH